VTVVAFYPCRGGTVFIYPIFFFLAAGRDLLAVWRTNRNPVLDRAISAFH